MKRILFCLMAAAAAATVFGGAVLAQEKPEFRLGFAGLAARIPDVVGQPLENEHHNPLNGDSLQQTTTGLMVWRKADNWTAFTDGFRTWIDGPLGIQERRNEERLDWESRATPVPAPMPSPTAAAAPSPTPAPSPTQAPKPNLRILQSNVLQGQGLEANSVWVMGEVRNDGVGPAYNVTVTARLLTESGSVAGTASQVFAFLGAGDTVGYRVEVRSVTAYALADVSADSSSSGFAAFSRLPIAWVKNEQVGDSQSGIRYEFAGTMNNGGSQPVSLNAVYVWFLDDQNRVVWMDYTYVPNALAPGDSSTFTVRTARDRENPWISSISQVRYYAAGRLP